MNALATAGFYLAETPLNPDDVKPGWVALGVVAALCFATFLLARSFLKHAKKAEQPWDGE